MKSNTSNFNTWGPTDSVNRYPYTAIGKETKTYQNLNSLISVKSGIEFSEIAETCAQKGKPNTTYMGTVSCEGLPEEIESGVLTVTILSTGFVKYTLNNGNDQWECYFTNGETTEWSKGESGGVVNLMVETTYQELKDLRDNGQLIPGAKYRIIDYETIVDENKGVKSANHKFDIIVEALSTDVLSENASAIQSKDDKEVVGINIYMSKTIHKDVVYLSQRIQCTSHGFCNFIVELPYLGEFPVYGQFHGEDFVIYHNEYEICKTTHYETVCVNPTYIGHAKRSSKWYFISKDGNDFIIGDIIGDRVTYYDTVEDLYENIGVTNVNEDVNINDTYKTSLCDDDNQYQVLVDNDKGETIYGDDAVSIASEYFNIPDSEIVDILQNTYNIYVEDKGGGLIPDTFIGFKYTGVENININSLGFLGYTEDEDIVFVPFNIFNNVYNLKVSTINYFTNSSLQSWKIKYCIDNDNEKHPFACNNAIVLENTQIVYNNHTYNFVKRIDGNVCGVEGPFYSWQTNESGVAQYLTTIETDLDIERVYHTDISYKCSTFEERGVVDEVIYYQYSGKGVIYEMIDEFNNNAPYDFKNLRFDTGEGFNIEGSITTSGGVYNFVEWFNNGTCNIAVFDNDYYIPFGDAESLLNADEVFQALKKSCEPRGGISILSNDLQVSSSGEIGSYTFNIGVHDYSLDGYCKDNSIYYPTLLKDDDLPFTIFNFDYYGYNFIACTSLAAGQVFHIDDLYYGEDFSR